MKKGKYKFISLLIILSVLIIVIVLLIKFLPRHVDITIPQNAEQNGYNNYIYCGDVAYVNDSMYYVDNRPLIGGVRKIKDNQDVYLCKSGKLYGFGSRLYLINKAINDLYTIEQIDLESGSLSLIAKDVYRFKLRENDVLYSIYKKNKRNVDVEVVYSSPVAGGMPTETKLSPASLDVREPNSPKWLSHYNIPFKEGKQTWYGTFQTTAYQYNKIGEDEYVSGINVEVYLIPLNWYFISHEQSSECVGLWKLMDGYSVKRVGEHAVEHFALFNTEYAYYVRNGRLCAEDILE